VVVLLPGVPREMRGLLVDEVLPRLVARQGAERRVVVSRTVRTTGVSESALAERVGPIEPEIAPLTLAYLPSVEGVDLRVTAGHVAGHQPGVVGQRRQQVAGAKVAGFDALLPRHPLWRQQRGRTWNQYEFANRGLGCAWTGRDHDGPLPASVTRHVGQEPMRRGGRVLEAGAEVLTQGALAAELDDRGARLLDGAHQHRLQAGAIVGVNAVHRHQ